jgi:hypothetical protein
MDRNELFDANSTKGMVAHTVAITVVCAIAGMVASKGAEQGYLKGLSAIRNYRGRNIAQTEL